MPVEIVAIVLVAALAHASWNALVKSDDDRLVTLGTTNAVRFLICVPLVLALPLRLAQAGRTSQFRHFCTSATTSFSSRPIASGTSARSIRSHAASPR